MKYCKHCGTPLDDSANFCTNCGKNPNPVEVAQASAQAAAQNQPQQAPQSEQPYQDFRQQPYYAQSQPQSYAQPGSRLGRLSFIFGLIGLIVGCLFGLIGLFTSGVFSFLAWPGVCLSVAGLVTGIIGKKKNPDDPKAKIGFILSLIGIIAGSILFIIGIVMLTAATMLVNYHYTY